MSLRARVLYAPRNTAGQATEYVAAVAPFGYEGEVWSYGPPAFGFGADRVFDKVTMRTDPKLRWAIVDEAVRGFDVFHFQYGRSLLDPRDVTVPDLWDIPLLKSLGKKVFMHWRGSDVRLPSQHRQREATSYFDEAGLDVDEDRIEGKIAICRRFCDGMFVSTPGLLDYVPDATWIPHVIDVDAWSTAPRDEPAVPLVVHVPSDRGTKGSAHVEAAVRPLLDAGVIRYQGATGLTRAELRDLLAEADIVVDSLTIGDHGLLSVEAMASRCVAVAHIHADNRDRNPGVPVVEATPATLEDVLRQLALDPARRTEHKDASVEWVAKRHDRSVIGPLLAEHYGRPLRRPTSAVPDWPRSDEQQRVAQLEAEIDRLRGGSDPYLGAARIFELDPSKYVTSQLVGRIRELEAALRAAGPSPRSPVVGQASWRLRVVHFLERHPTLDRLARRLKDRLRL